MRTAFDCEEGRNRRKKQARKLVFRKIKHNLGYYNDVFGGSSLEFDVFIVPLSEKVYSFMNL